MISASVQPSAKRPITNFNREPRAKNDRLTGEHVGIEHNARMLCHCRLSPSFVARLGDIAAKHASTGTTRLPHPPRRLTPANARLSDALQGRRGARFHPERVYRARRRIAAQYLWQQPRHGTHPRPLAHHRHIIEGALQASGRAGSHQVKDANVSFVGATAPIVTSTTFIFVREPY